MRNAVSRLRITSIRWGRKICRLALDRGESLLFTSTNDSQIYLEVKHHRMESKPQSTSWVLVTEGYRW